MNFDVCFLTNLVQNIKRNSFTTRNPAAMSQCKWYVLQHKFLVQKATKCMCFSKIKRSLVGKCFNGNEALLWWPLWASAPNHMYSPRIFLPDLGAAAFGSFLPYLAHFSENLYTRVSGEVNKRRRELICAKNEGTQRWVAHVQRAQRCLCDVIT